MPTRLEYLRDKFEGNIKYDYLLVAVNYILEHFNGSKDEAVQFIQENSGGGTGSDYEDTGQTEDGNVWGRATHCASLSSWLEIIFAVSSILQSQGIE